MQDLAEPDRARGALLGLAIGDALGMPTQVLSRAAIRALFGEVVWFEPGPQQNPISRGLPAGRVTDDTDQALLVAQALIDGGGRVDPHRLAADLVAWEAHMAEIGSLDLLGPSTKRALAALAAGAPPETTGRGGDTDGAAMRIAGVGIATQPAPLPALVARVADVSRLTHDTAAAVAGAAAVAAAVSAGVGGADLDGALALAVEAARVAEQAYPPDEAREADVPGRIARAIEGVRAIPDPAAALDHIAGHVGTGVAAVQAAPAAFALLALFPGEPWRVVLAAANLGGDTDTIGAMAGAVAGAIAGPSGFPAAAVELVESVNDLGLAQLVEGLLALRHGAPV